MIISAFRLMALSFLTVSVIRGALFGWVPLASQSSHWDGFGVVSPDSWLHLRKMSLSGICIGKSGSVVGVGSLTGPVPSMAMSGPS